MSLHSLANHLQSAGRGEDKVLVHMTPKEVNGLQSLAMAHGGSLTTNPDTGLPEAGFLSSILPMIAGFALGPAGLGLTAMQAGVASTALGTMLTGDLKKGIMAGIGAYGGAGLGSGLMVQGAEAAAAPVGQNAAQTAITNAGNNAANFAGQGSNVFSTNPMFNPAAGTGGGMTGFQTGVSNVAPATTTAAANTATTAAATYPPGHPLYTPVQSQMNLASQSFTPSSATPGINPTSLAERQAILARTTPVDMADPNAFVTTNVPNQPITRPLLDDPGFTQYRDAAKLTPRPASPYVQPDRLAQYKDIKFAEGMQHTPTTSTAVDVSGQGISRPFTDRMSQLGRGFEASTKSFEGLKGLYDAMPTGSVIASGLTLAEAMKPEDLKEKKDTGMIRPYEFEYGATNTSGEPYSGSAERMYFQPRYTALKPYRAPGPEYAASGGLMGFAVGGAVEEMAAQNAVGANTGYPMANLQTPMYANPMIQRPEATNVIAPSVDAGVGTYTGEARFAFGGPTTTQGTATPKTTGGYSYSYNPQTQQFTQTGAPGAAASNRSSTVNPNGGPAFMGPVGSGHYGAGSYSKNARLTNGMSDENYLRSEAAGGRNRVAELEGRSNKLMPANGTTSGGMAQPAMQPVTQPANPAQPFVPNINIPAYQTPEQQLGLGGFYGMMNEQLGGYGGYAGYAAGGGVSTLGGYSDGGRLLKGPGDGVSDSIPASIGNRQPARLADGEFVVPARIVSEIGNGSTEAGARKLYAMMDRVQRARRKTTGKNQVARNTKAEKLLPA